jgi:hypothetical protein
MIELATEIKKLPEMKVQLQEGRLQLNSDDDEEDPKIQVIENQQNNDTVPGHIMRVLEERHLKIQEIIAWIEGPCEEWLVGINQICKSSDEVQRLESQYEQMMDEFRVSFLKVHHNLRCRF